VSCPCRTGERIFVVRVPEWTGGLAGFRNFTFGGTWSVDERARLIEIRIGGASTWRSAADVVNFFRGVLDAEGLARVRAGWRAEGALPCSIESMEASPCCGGEGGSHGGEPLVFDERPIADWSEAEATPIGRLLEEERIETFYQPIFRAGDLGLWGFECLARARDESEHVIEAEQLLAWARQERLTFMFDRVCRETHIRNAAAAGLPDEARIVVNFLPTAIYDPAFCLASTEAAVRSTGLDTSRLIFEAVESDEVSDRERFVAILGHYRDGGYRVALDDMGVGHAGLLMLAELEPDIIKIDHGLIAKAATSPRHLGSCEALVRLGKVCGASILAEGIETREQLRMMTELGVDCVQGFLLGRPAPEPVTECAIPPRRSVA